MKYWFNEWEWLKNNCGGKWSFTRVVGAISIVIIQVGISIYIITTNSVKDINNVWQWLVISTPTIGSVMLFGFEVIKENKAFSMRIGTKEFGFSKEGKDKKNNDDEDDY